MNSFSNRLTLTLSATILLPLVLYVIFEISSVSEGEEMIDRVYTEQLDAIIFSINQFSNDNINGLLNKLESEIDDSLNLKDGLSFLDFSNFDVLLFEDIENGNKSFQVLNPDISDLANWQTVYDSVLSDDASKRVKKRLIQYKQGGYRKIEPLQSMQWAERKYQVIHAVLEHNQQSIYFVGLLNINGFATEVLAPRLQQIADQELILSLTVKGSGEVICQTDDLRAEAMFKKEMWLFPEIEVGISSKNKTVKELVNERMTSNLIALGLLIGLLLIGFTLIIRNFRRELNLVQTKSDFVSNVSHELRTPLSLISMFAETLYLDRVPNQKKRKEYEEIILKETTRLTNIVNKILNFSQIEANKRTYNPSSTDINQVVTELLHDYSYHIENNGFTFAVDLVADMPDCMIDRDALYEALVNLTDNAIKYSDENKHLHFRTGIRDNEIYVEVQDQGIGIKPEKVSQIFEKFFRVTDGDVQNTRGAGLGLSLVHHIMEAHHGDVEVVSDFGKGSTFRLVFKLKEDVKNTNS